MKLRQHSTKRKKGTRCTILQICFKGLQRLFLNLPKQQPWSNVRGSYIFQRWQTPQQYTKQHEGTPQIDWGANPWMRMGEERPAVHLMLCFAMKIMASPCMLLHSSTLVFAKKHLLVASSPKTTWHPRKQNNPNISTKLMMQHGSATIFSMTQSLWVWFMTWGPNKAAPLTAWIVSLSMASRNSARPGDDQMISAGWGCFGLP